MDEYIKREAALSAVDCGNLHKGIVDALQENIKDIPAADVVEVRHGRWEEWWPGDCALIMTGEEMLWMCNKCTAKFSDRSAYCPNCGARMDGGADDAAD